VPLDFLTVQAFDTYQLERMRVPRAAASDYVLSGCPDNTWSESRSPYSACT